MGGLRTGRAVRRVPRGTLWLTAATALGIGALLMLLGGPGRSGVGLGIRSAQAQTRAPQLPPDADGERQLSSAIDSIVTGQAQSAVGPLQTLAQHWPSDARVHYHLGVALKDTGENAQAMMELGRSLELMPASDWTHRSQALWAMALTAEQARDCKAAACNWRRYLTEAVHHGGEGADLKIARDHLRFCETGVR